MPNFLTVGRTPGEKVEAIQQMTVAAAPSANFVIGSLVVADIVTGLIDLCGANPQLIAGVALAAPSSAPGFNAANTPATFTGRANKVAVALANGVTQFKGHLTNNSAVYVNPADADIGQQYGVTKLASNEWVLDKNKVGDQARVVVVGYDSVDPTIVFFKVLVAFQQFAQ